MKMSKSQNIRTLYEQIAQDAMKGEDKNSSDTFGVLKANVKTRKANTEDQNRSNLC